MRSRLENSLVKINYHPNSAFELRKSQSQMDEKNVSSAFPGVTKVSLPVWRVPQFRVQPGNSTLTPQNGNEPPHPSGKEKDTHPSSWKYSPASKAKGTESAPFAGDKERVHKRSDERKAIYEQQSGNKRDSMSDTEGMSGLKRLLQKETEQNDALVGQGQDANKFMKLGGIKKSPSAGSTSYWSRISFGGQPSFLRKFFEKSSPTPGGAEVEEMDTENQNTKTTTIAAVPEIATVELELAAEADLPESILSLNVAQKANMFMKLEHEQRFSKWHNSSQNAKPNTEGRPRSTRFSTQPVTTEEFYSATKGLDDFQSNSENLHLIAQAQTSLPIAIQPGNLPSSVDDDGQLLSGSELLEPSRLSLKDRVSMFNRMSVLPMANIQSRPSSNSKLIGSNSKLDNSSGSEYTNTCGLISKSLNNDTDSSYDNLPGFKKNEWNALRKRRGSDSSVMVKSAHLLENRQVQDQPASPLISSRIPVAMLRNTKVKSMFVPQAFDADTLSEDGEISSGGQEVAEIISRSFENSPIFRKKSWRTQQPQPSFAKELWRKFGKTDENTRVSNAVQQPALSHQLNPITSPLFPRIKRGGATATSNLLPILTALSSSDDQLSEANKTSNAPPIKPRRSNLRKMLNQKPETVESSSHPSEMQIFATSDGDHIANKTSFVNSEINSLAENAQLTHSDELAFSSVKREGDLLVMKKHMPILRRKSSGKSKNPLKVLAARMDFRNQKYTETLMDNDQRDQSPVVPS